MDLEDSPEGWLGFTRERVSKPTVAAVEGHCVAGGLAVALWCDLRVAAEGATFGCFERRFGVPLVDGGTQRLPRVVELGRAVDAETAERWGFVTRLVPDGEALSRAVDLGERIAGFPRETVLTAPRCTTESGHPSGRGSDWGGLARFAVAPHRTRGRRASRRR